MLENDRALRRRIQDILVDLSDVSLDQLDLSRLLRQVFAALRENDVRVPSDLLKLLKALTALEAVAATLDPDFNLAAEVARHMQRLILLEASPKATIKRAATVASSYASILERLPEDIEGLLEQVRRRELGVSLSHRGLGRMTAALVFASRLVSAAVLLAALLVAGAIVLLASPELGGVAGSLGYALIAAAVVLGFLLAIRHFRYRNRRERRLIRRGSEEHLGSDGRTARLRRSSASARHLRPPVPAGQLTTLGPCSRYLSASWLSAEIIDSPS